jgi:hypothetical protein
MKYVHTFIFYLRRTVIFNGKCSGFIGFMELIFLSIGKKHVLLRKNTKGQRKHVIRYTKILDFRATKTKVIEFAFNFQFPEVFQTKKNW